jgi:hypothetical protein
MCKSACVYGQGGWFEGTLYEAWAGFSVHPVYAGWYLSSAKLAGMYNMLGSSGPGRERLDS